MPSGRRSSSPYRASASSQTSSRRKSGSSRNKSGSNKSTKGFRVTIVGIFALSIILVSLIISLDHRAVENGHIGLYETLTNANISKSPQDVETRYRDALNHFGITQAHLIQEGRVPGRETERLYNRIYKIQSRETWLNLTNQLNEKLHENGVTTHNRSITKNTKRWNLILFLGTPSERTHKIEIYYEPSVEADEEPVVSSPAPQPTASTVETTTNARIALVFDDFGADISIAEQFLNDLNVPITLAVIPNLKHSADVIRLAKSRDQTAFLHLPMEPQDASQMESQTDLLTTDMDDSEIISLLDEIFDGLPTVDGVNNHMGSKFTTDVHRMEVVLSYLKSKKLPFLDSRTIADSVAAHLAKQIHLPFAKRDVFIDQGAREADVAGQLASLAKTASQNGTAIGIGHAQIETLRILKQRLPSYIDQGYRFIPVTEIMSVN